MGFIRDTFNEKERYEMEQANKTANPSGNFGLAGFKPPSFNQFPYESGYKEHGDPFESWYNQRLLPQPLQFQQTYGGLQSGIQNISDLLRNPGGLNPNVAGAIAPRLGQESQNIAQQFRNILSQQQGAAARGNLPVSLKAALESALNVSQERAQRGARAEALSESEQLRRQDTDQTYKLLQTILQFIQSGRGQATSQQALGAQEKASDDQKKNALIAAIGGLLAPATGGASLAVSTGANAAMNSGYW